MIIKNDLYTNITINNLADLKKLKPFMEGSDLKVNKSQIARELNVNVKTVGKYINGYKKLTTRNRTSKIDEFYPTIEELLLKSTTQVFYYKRVLWQYLTDNYNLNCAQSSFRRYITNHSEFNEYFRKHRTKNSANQAPMRYETEIGHQAQLDWKENMKFTLLNGEIITINIFVLLLSYSRFRIYRLSLSKTQDVLFSFINDAFETFGGVPKELLTDNMKTVMDEARTEYRKGKVNNKFQQFADDYNFKVFPCIAGRPNTKAKVEAPMKLLDEIQAYNGTLDYSKLHQLVEKLNNRINSQCHTTTGKIPILHLNKEKDFLSKLPTAKIRNLYSIILPDVTVNNQSMIHYKSNQYSVPPKYIGKKLKLQRYDDQIHIYYSTDLITVHTVKNQKLNYHHSHYVEISSLTLKKPIEDIETIAKNNLEIIGAVYRND